MSWLGETTPESKGTGYLIGTAGTGYLIGTAIFGVIFVVAVLVQIKAKKFHPFLYWLTIVATTTVGTTLADYCTRSLGIGYTGGSTILLICVIVSLLIWHWSTGSISIETVSTPKVEIFYWVTIMLFTTFVGYIAGGIPGAALATFFVFLPSFVFVLVGVHYIEKVRENRALQAFLAGVSAAVVGIIAVVSLDLIPEALIDWVTVAIAGAAFLLIALLKRDVALVALGAIIVGIIYSGIQMLS